MKYAVEKDSGAMICIPSFIKFGSDIQKLIGGDTQTHRQNRNRISLLVFFQNKESGLITSCNTRIRLFHLFFFFLWHYSPNLGLGLPP
jgi:hypothetical protein